MKMNSRLNLFLIAVILISGLVLFPSCAKKKVQVAVPEPVTAEVDEAPTEEIDVIAQQEELARAQAQAEAEAALRLEAQLAMEKEAFIRQDIHFDFDRYELRPDAREILAKKIEWLSKNSDINVLIQGHCDQRGPASYNVLLGKKRAEKTKAFLMANGINEERIAITSLGKEQPVDPGTGESAWSKNRRAHFIIQ